MSPGVDGVRSPGRARPLAVLRGVVGACVVAGYPFAMYYLLTRWGLRRAGFLVLVLVAFGAASSTRRLGRADLVKTLRTPLVVALLVGAGMLVDDRRFLLALPVVVNLAFLEGFAGSLRGPVPLVERFARLQHPLLTAEEVRYCRTVTVVWSIYFVVNILVCGALALWAPMSWWMFYTGFIAYLAMGCLFTVEYLTRKYRFRRFGTGLHDRLLERLLPVRADAASGEP